MLRTHSTLPGILVLSEIYQPGWKAHVDDKLGSLVRANGIFRAVYVPKGSHRVEVTYWPDGLTLGITVTGITLLLLLLLVGIRIGVLWYRNREDKLNRTLIEAVENTASELESNHET